MLYWEENHRFINAMRHVMGKKIKGRGKKSKSTQLYTPLDLSEIGSVQYDIDFKAGLSIITNA